MFCARLFICASWSPAGKGLTSWLSFVVSSVSLSLSLGQVWYLIVSIPDLCNLTYLKNIESLVYMHNLHPGTNLLPGAKLHPVVNLLPLM